MPEEVKVCDLCKQTSVKTIGSFEVKFAGFGSMDPLADSNIGRIARISIHERSPDLAVRDIQICEECLLKTVLSKPYRLAEAFNGNNIPEIEQ